MTKIDSLLEKRITLFGEPAFPKQINLQKKSEGPKGLLPLFGEKTIKKIGTHLCLRVFAPFHGQI